jgi:N-methylhydantoinase B/oxoprolinase/acetone carboxylase alpha subunit
MGVLFTNASSVNGAHFPGLTIVSAVLHEANPQFAVTSRSHHSEIGVCSWFFIHKCS